MINRPNDMKPKNNNQSDNYLRFHTPDQSRRYLDKLWQPDGFKSLSAFRVA
jgi:hypothetical protein